MTETASYSKTACEETPHTPVKKTIKKRKVTRPYKKLPDDVLDTRMKELHKRKLNMESKLQLNCSRLDSMIAEKNYRSEDNNKEQV